jgi:hypothetical protein
MSVAAIFDQLHDPTTRPAPPPRQLPPASATDLRPAQDELAAWVTAQREDAEDQRRSFAG